jgi:hypothetical protein
MMRTKELSTIETKQLLHLPRDSVAGNIPVQNMYSFKLYIIWIRVEAGKHILDILVIA